ncbi:NitT/TauT family transport system substrate-binding protein [Nonomuraea polychroma]|uniref:NitT/TauT family transport system substrate-binding protein n=1 Tax=Nonomuraea polychroma TaxID=46176 RepID=A0A438LZ22_9ACTN|nr:ABC transporter substrate-binding protein [Nonomuraea polychroma]RVX38553.1 NitT/TauT family transport system substrate-binding protein [Nonomuraea polychroma]
MRRVTRGLAALVLALSTAACSGAADNTPPPKPRLEKDTIKVGVMPTTDVAPLYLALLKGYFEQEGLTVEPVTVTGSGAAVPQVISGFLDLAQTDYVTSFLAGSHDVPVKVVGALAQAGPNTFGLVARKGAKIESVEDLKGKKIAVNNLNGIATLTVTAMLRDAGLKAGDVKFVEMPFPEMPARVAARKADAAWVAQPFLTQGERSGQLRRVTDPFADRIADMPVSGWMASAPWAKENPNTLAAFQRAIAKAQQLATGNPKEVEAVLPMYIKIDRETAAKTSLGAYPTAIDPQRLQRLVDLMRQNGHLKRPLDVKTVLAP